MRVLVVDDGADVRFMLRVVLEDAGMEVEEAGSGAQALEVLDGPHEIDALVVDQRMPLMTGLELARELKEREVGMPLILFSAYLHPAMLAQAEELNVKTLGKTDVFALPDILRDCLTPA
jgi:CheY-like chemotaxis protein